jgi:hypothetical protein
LAKRLKASQYRLLSVVAIDRGKEREPSDEPLPLSGESIRDRDVVLWYAGHFTHDLTQEEPATHGHIIGPDLVPENW